MSSRKKFWLIFTSIVASLVLIITVCLSVTKLKNVTVEFRSREGQETTMLADGVLDKVKETAEFSYGKNLLFMNFDKNIENIEKSNPYIKVHQIVRHFPGTVRVYVTERIPKYRVQDKSNNSKWYILDEEFKVVDFVDGTIDAIKANIIGKTYSYYDKTIEISPETLKITAFVSDFVSYQEIQNLNNILSGVYKRLGAYTLIKSIKISQDVYSITMKNPANNNDDGVLIEVNGANNIYEKARLGANAYTEDVPPVGKVLQKIIVEEISGKIQVRGEYK